jgi:hypothetical protein
MKILRALAVSPLAKALPLVGLLLVTATQATAQEISAPDSGWPAIPTNALDSYRVTVVQEQLESTLLPRWQLQGQRTLQMDPIDGHIAARTQGDASARFVIESAPEFKVELFSFPSDAFEWELEDETLNLYLQGKQVAHSPEQNFKILEESAFSNTGPSKFRILGRRAYTIRYSYEDVGATLVCGENWVEIGDHFYIVRVTAPTRGFDLQYEDARVAFNSIVEVE